RHGGQGQIGEVFVIDRIELVLRDQPQEMWKLEGGDARGLEQQGAASDEIIDVRNMRQNIVGRREIGLFAQGRKLTGQTDAIEVLDDFEALLTRRCCGTGRRLYSQARNTAFLE